MANTIKGRSLEAFFEELRKPIPMKTRDTDGSTYFAVSDVKKRVQELLLPSNYDYSCTPVQLFNVGSFYSFTLIGRLVIKNDAGETVLVREVPGGSDIQFLNSDPNRPANALKSSISTAESAAFVNCWLSAGFSSCVDLSYKKKGKEGSNAVSSTVQRTDEIYDIEFLSELSVKSDMVQGKVKVKGETVPFRIFKEGLSYFEKNNKVGRTMTRQEVLKCLITNYGVSKVKNVRCYGYFNEWNGQKQFVLTKGV